MAEAAKLSAVSAFARLAVPTAIGAPAGVTVRERRDLGLAIVTVRKGAASRLASALLDEFGLTLADGPKVSSSNDLAFVGIGPGTWLAVKPGGGWRFATDLAGRVAGIAAVADQSSGYGVLRLEGPRVRDVLAKGVPIDLDPSVFRPGDAAVTLAGHVGIVLWQAGEEPGYDVAVFRSYAESFWAWLTASAAEFGLSVADPAD